MDQYQGHAPRRWPHRRRALYTAERQCCVCRWYFETFDQNGNVCEDCIEGNLLPPSSAPSMSMPSALDPQLFGNTPEQAYGQDFSAVSNTNYLPDTMPHLMGDTYPMAPDPFSQTQDQASAHPPSLSSGGFPLTPTYNQNPMTMDFSSLNRTPYVPGFPDNGPGIPMSDNLDPMWEPGGGLETGNLPPPDPPFQSEMPSVSTQNQPPPLPMISQQNSPQADTATTTTPPQGETRVHQPRPLRPLRPRTISHLEQDDNAYSGGSNIPGAAANPPTSSSAQMLNLGLGGGGGGRGSAGGDRTPAHKREAKTQGGGGRKKKSR
ncbi:hypothetical protein F4777DRAFT_97827 [Nemania sp. FL0916]|nr:hypothetical protein F4777DRAFT_97827 [Nemania sp. FL0916]